MATSNEIREHCNLKDIDPFIKAYVRKGYIERTKNDAKLVVYSISPKGRLLGSADALYNQAKVKQPSKMVSKSSDRTPPLLLNHDKDQQTYTNAQLTETKNGFVLEAEPVGVSNIAAEQQSEEKLNIEFKLDTTQHIRFALTDEGTLLILGLQYAPIELSKEDTRRLYDFAENTVHAI